MLLRKFLLLASLCLLLTQPALARQQVPADALLQSAELGVSGGNYKAAIDLYSKALKQRKNDPLILQRRANAKLLMQQPKAAIADLNKSTAVAPNDPTNYELRARAFEALKNYKKEKADLDKLITLTPPNGVNLLWRAHISAQLKQMKDVIADCNQALPLGLQRKDLVDLYNLRAEAYKKLGKKREAAQELARA